MPGFQASEKTIAKENILLKAARGQAPLIKLYGNLNAESSKVKRLPALDLRENTKQTLEKLLRIGVVRQLAAPLDPISDSALYRIAEGDVRVAAIVSPGSLRTRLHFQSMSLPTGARVFVYSMSDPDEFYGPYEGHGASDDGTFWTPPLTGEGVVIEYFTPAGSALIGAPFRISEVSHNYKALPASQTDAAGACNVEVTAEWANVAKSVAMLDFMTGGFEALCTGTLLNDSNPTLDHYVLTANHCINTQAEANSAFAYWNYDTGETPPSGNASYDFDLAVTGSSSDFTLLHRGAVPPGLFFSGWDASPVSAGTSVTGIHHPNGSHKRISFGSTNSNCDPALPGPCANFTGVVWSQGTTEPGSSGSGLWTGSPASAMLVGTLTGGDASCSVPTGNDYYGRFSATYPNISGFLNGSCVSGVSPSSQSFPASGGTSSFTVSAPAGCSWTASSTETFLTITSGSSGTGNGTVSFSVAGNNGLQRSGSIVVGKQLFNANQAAGGVCTPTPIGVGQTINGTLSTSDCPLGDGFYADAYGFNGSSGQKISILMTSSAFDTVLYLLNPDGSLLTADDDGGGGTNSRIPTGSGFFTLSTTGSYTILASSFDPGATGTYSLTLSEPPTQTLTISSLNPNTGVSVNVTPVDRNGRGNGTTQFGRSFYQYTTVILDAAGTAGTNIVFLKWQKDGVDYSTSTSTTVTMDVDHVMTAVYGPTPTFVLTVTSSNPSSGVPITVTPIDNGNLGNGSTSFARTYNRFTQVTLTAPLSAGGNYFIKWQDNGADLTTDRTTRVFMQMNHTLTAVYFTIPPTPTPTPTPTPSGPGQAVAYQIDPAHTGSQFDSVGPPLVRRWSHDLGNPVSYPLIAGGRVFVTTGAAGLFALDASNGATLWATGDIGVSPAAAYDAGRVFVITHNGLLRAFDATTGTQVWTRQLSGQAFTSPPTATGGTVYVSGDPTMHAVSEQDGSIKWSTLNAGGDSSSPAVSANAVFGAYSCNNVWALLPSTGAVLWHHTSSCFGGGGRTAVLFGGRLYARDEALSNATLDAGTGTQVDEFLAGPAPAFNGSSGYLLNGTTLEARDVPSGTLKWSFTGDGTLSSAPIVVNGYVYVGSTSGKLYALSESTGANVWTGTVGAAVNRPDEHNLSAPVGLGAGEGLIVVPASNLLVAYQPSQTPPSQTIQFNSASYNVNEGDGRVNITLTRSGDTTSSASVNFGTIDSAGLTNCNVFNGIASPRCDYINTIGTATWAAGDATSKTFSVAIVDDSYAEGPETFTVSLNNPSGATLGAQSTATVTIIDNDATTGPNPIDNTNSFVRQQYIDFLGREPDPLGLAGWTATINNCSTDHPGHPELCDRIHVSQQFFQSAEFQDRGYFVYRFYDVAFGRKPDYSEFVPDLASVSGFLDVNQLEAAKVAFVNAFMTKPAFVSAYNSLTNQQYVDMLLNTAGVMLSSRQSMIDGLNNSTMTRAQVLRQIVESGEVAAKYNHQAYAVMEYFGYLRRQPDAFYLDWIKVLDQSNDPRGMVTGFATSQEYRSRFGP